MLKSAACWSKRRAGLMGGVFQHNAEIFEEETIAQRRLDADIGGDAGKHQMANTATAQNAIEWCVKKPL